MAGSTTQNKLGTPHRKSSRPRLEGSTPGEIKEQGGLLSSLREPKNGGDTRAIPQSSTDKQIGQVHLKSCPG